MIPDRYVIESQPDLPVMHEYGYLKALAHYRADTYRGKIVLMTTQELYRKEPHDGWSEFARARLEIHQIVVDHNTCMKEHEETTPTP